MKDQIHVRSAEAAHLARTLARQTDKTISEVVLEALRQYQPVRPSAAPDERLAQWHRLLSEDRGRRVAGPETPIEALYDEDTGLPR